MVESPFEGMEHQTAIAYGNGYKNLKFWNFDYIILHEVAHEWWGNAVSTNDYADIWIHEGFATYSEALYVEHVYAYDKYLLYLDYEEYNVKNKQPIVRVMNVNYWNHNDVYSKGSLVLHTLREYIDNDDLFFDILSSFYEDNKYKIVNSKDFIDLVNTKTKENLNWFFDQYLFDRRVPILKMDIYYGNDSYEFIAHWENVNAYFKLPIEIIDNNGDFKRIIITTEKQKFDNGSRYPYLSDRERSYFKYEKVK